MGEKHIPTAGSSGLSQPLKPILEDDDQSEEPQAATAVDVRGHQGQSFYSPRSFFRESIDAIESEI